MKNSYGKLLAIRGAAGFTISSLLGRIPAGMLALAIVFPVYELLNAYSSAGLVTASAMGGLAMCAPSVGRLVDRHGQFVVLLVFALLNLVATSWLIASIHFGLPLGVICISAAATGATRVSTGTMARARWVNIVRSFDSQQRKGLIRTAYAWEAVADEIVFISAPIIATFLCIRFHPLAGLACCLAAHFVGTTTLAAQRASQPEIKPRSGGQKTSPLGLPGLPIVCIAALFEGVSAGALEVLVVARANALGVSQIIGFLMAILALSSMIAGLWYGARSFKLPNHLLWMRCLGLLVLGLAVFAFTTNLPALAFSLFLTGLFVGPTAIAGQVFAEQVLPSELLTEGMSFVVTSMILGMACGAWISGILIDHLGAFRAGLLPVLSVVVAFLAATRLQKCSQ